MAETRRFILEYMCWRCATVLKSVHHYSENSGDVARLKAHWRNEFKDLIGTHYFEHCKDNPIEEIDEIALLKPMKE